MARAAVCDSVRRLIHVMFLVLWATLALDTRRAASSLSRSYTCAVTLDTARMTHDFLSVVQRRSCSLSLCVSPGPQVAVPDGVWNARKPRALAPQITEIPLPVG